MHVYSNKGFVFDLVATTKPRPYHPKRKELCNLILTYFQKANFCHSRKIVKKYFFGEFASVLIWKILLGTILQEGNA